MRWRRCGEPSEGERVRLSMTPMIDIVFLLLVFFLMTFRIVPQEGDFAIETPAPVGADGFTRLTPDTLPLILRLEADGQGNLARIRVNERSLETFDELHRFVVAYLGDDPRRRDEAAVEIQADESLRYEFTIAAMTAVRGRRTPDGRIEDLITNIALKPR
ncbi:MAG: biopolymer transporter ExbD [Pirellulaceae bacterium]